MKVAKKKTPVKKKSAVKPPVRKAKALKAKATARKPKVKTSRTRRVTRTVKIKAAKPASRPVKIAHRDEMESPKKIKSPLSRKEIKDYYKLLMEKRTEILGDMKTMAADALNSDSANLSHMPIHMADVGSDHYEQELTLGLVESERKLVQEIDEALERIAAGTFGVCEATGKPITKARLAAKPWAKYCIEYARELERFGRRR